MTPKQIDRALSVLERFASVAERWADVEYPKTDENTPEATFSRQGVTEEPDSQEAYAALPEQEGRFERAFREAHT